MRVAGTTLGASILVAGCGFHPAGGAGGDGDGDSIDAASGDPAEVGWWDTAYQQRIPLAVSAGAMAPQGGYPGYTVRVGELDSASLIEGGLLRSDCADLRVARWNGSEWSELERHVLGCGGAAEVRFMLAADIATGATDRSHYLYLGNPDAEPAAALRTTNVYLWYDDTSADRSRAYQGGRLDSWGSTNTWIDTLTFNDGGYEYVRDDNQVSSYRRAVAERDVYVEAQFLHTGCSPGNMVTGVVVRGIIASGAGGSEEADHYYASMRGQQAICGDGYTFDGDIVATTRDLTAVDGPDPPPVATGVWRAQALAASGADPTHLTFWDLDAAWGSPGWPPKEAVLAEGDHDADHDQAGFAGVWMAQDAGRFRGVLVRRYVVPEPVIETGAAENVE